MARTQKPEPTPESLEWLMAENRGRPRIQGLGWKRLARIYLANPPDSTIRRAIEREARRCGYTPRTILALHAE